MHLGISCPLGRLTFNKKQKFMWNVNNTLCRHSLILGSAIALLTACSQPIVGRANEPSSSVSNTGTSSSAANQPIKATTSVSQTEFHTCHGKDLKAVLNEMQGAVGSRYGIIKFTNTGDTACILQGHPQIELLNARGQSLPVNKDTLQSDEVGLRVTLQPRQSAYLPFKWSNWCEKVPNNEIKFVVSLPQNHEQVSVVLPDGPEYHDTPPCNGPDQPSILSVGLFNSTPSP